MIHVARLGKFEQCPCFELTRSTPYPVVSYEASFVSYEEKSILRYQECTILCKIWHNLDIIPKQKKKSKMNRYTASIKIIVPQFFLFKSQCINLARLEWQSTVGNVSQKICTCFCFALYCYGCVVMVINYLHIEAETKWPPFSKRHNQGHFLEWKLLYSDLNFINYVLRGPLINKLALVQIMAWRPIGDTPLSGPMAASFTDRNMRRSIKMS